MSGRKALELKLSAGICSRGACTICFADTSHARDGLLPIRKQPPTLEIPGAAQLDCKVANRLSGEVDHAARNRRARRHLDSNVSQSLSVVERDRLPGHGRDSLTILCR